MAQVFGDAVDVGAPAAEKTSPDSHSMHYEEKA
jgi:hypothetical protein